MSRGDSSGFFSAVRHILSPGVIGPIQSWFTQPDPHTAGYILILAAGTGISVAGALLPLYLSWWWLDTAGHVVGGFTLTLGLLILFPRTQAVLGVVVLSALWETIEWSIGYPFLVTPSDTKLDLLAGWAGSVIALVGAIAVSYLADHPRS